MRTDLNAVLFGVSTHIPVRFCVGDTVDVLNASLLPKHEEVAHTGTIRQIDRRADHGLTLHWINGCPTACPASQLRLVRRAR